VHVCGGISGGQKRGQWDFWWPEMLSVGFLVARNVVKGKRSFLQRKPTKIKGKHLIFATTTAHNQRKTRVFATETTPNQRKTHVFVIKKQPKS